ncbi:hypothetical protein WMY93_019102 [Mugilogobius chulae]|uniref:Uncharacterized protein n=1 Tax=Mugilogobius chulae TaxID=88201 RepID=A0AAW0NQG4_9GOBI
MREEADEARVGTRRGGGGEEERGREKRGEEPDCRRDKTKKEGEGGRGEGGGPKRERRGREREDEHEGEREGGERGVLRGRERRGEREGGQLRQLTGSTDRGERSRGSGDEGSWDRDRYEHKVAEGLKERRGIQTGGGRGQAVDRSTEQVRVRGSHADSVKVLRQKILEDQLRVLDQSVKSHSASVQKFSLNEAQNEEKLRRLKDQVQQRESERSWFHLSAQQFQAELCSSKEGRAWLRTRACPDHVWCGGSSLLLEGLIPTEQTAAAYCPVLSESCRSTLPWPPPLVCLVYKASAGVSVFLEMSVQEPNERQMSVSGVCVFQECVCFRMEALRQKLASGRKLIEDFTKTGDKLEKKLEQERNFREKAEAEVDSLAENLSETEKRLEQVLQKLEQVSIKVNETEKIKEERERSMKMCRVRDEVDQEKLNQMNLQLKELQTGHHGNGQEVQTGERSEVTRRQIIDQVQLLEQELENAEERSDNAHTRQKILEDQLRVLDQSVKSHSASVQKFSLNEAQNEEKLRRLKDQVQHL